ncbi:MAG TPA: 4-alpha-glucanotransferase [Lacunisphaera sp.]|jgi:4-alpha-glucanotransferase|nr:4-alpha-glucanotransferase [Lacunisphaera sp.]
MPVRKKSARPPAPAAPLFDWLRERAAGVLLHPTCLPGDQGCGVLDRHAVAFLDFLRAAGMKYWQVCPLGPTGYGDSPYQCFSAFAGNPYLIDLAALVEAGLLAAPDLAGLAALPREHVDYGALYRLKPALLATAHARFAARPVALPYGDFAAFCAAQAGWLDDYAAFRALKDHFAGAAWWDWPAEARDHRRALPSPLLRRLAPAIASVKFGQYLFFGQWAQIRAAAHARGVELIGDLPIFVAADSADAWAHPELFELAPGTLRPVAVAGVPPDYFSADGQLWGNPLYAWPAHAADGYAWWLARLRASFALCDVVRIDHFRGFDAYWRVPLPAENARQGEWIPGPGLDLFRAFRAALPDARIIAEDLGVLTDSVRRLRTDTGLPGMSVLQFAWGGDATNAYLPHNATANSVVYAGTHDNDTTLGWYRTAPEAERDHVRRYLRVSGDDIAWDFIRTACASVARLAILTLPDILGLGAEARFNTPSRAEGNWQWRVRSAALEKISGGTAAYLRELAQLTGR